MTRQAISPRLAMRRDFSMRFRSPAQAGSRAARTAASRRPGSGLRRELPHRLSRPSGLSPSLANSAASAPSPAFGVVSSLSPVKMLFAPARKQSACVLSDMLSRPADRRTIDFGMVMRATATVRTNSMSSIGLLLAPHVAEHRALDRHQRVDRHALGMARKGRQRVDEADAVVAASRPCRRCRRSRPQFPPSRTSSSVSSRSWKVRVVMISP